MTDPADRAEEEIERDLAEALRRRRPAGPQACGVCLFCDAFVRDGMRWCGPECRDAWEREQRREQSQDD